MKTIFRLLGIICLIFAYNYALAQGELITPPVVYNNVHVIKNTTQAQCPSSWNGSGGAASMTDVSGYGMQTGIDVVGVLSCTQCAFDEASHDCVCARCYGYYN